MTIHERIKKRRTDIGMSADDVAEFLGVSRATVYRYESSYIEKLPTSVLEPLAKALKTTPAYLMGWEEQKEDSKVIYVSEDKKDIIEAMDELTADDLKIVMDMINRMKK